MLWLIVFWTILTANTLVRGLMLHLRCVGLVILHNLELILLLFRMSIVLALRIVVGVGRLIEALASA